MKDVKYPYVGGGGTKRSSEALSFDLDFMNVQVVSNIGLKYKIYL